MSNDKVYRMSFSKIYEMLVNKATKKGRTKEEVDEIISWLCGYSRDDIDAMSQSDLQYGDFFMNAPKLNKNRHLITGSICGVKVETIEEHPMQEIRYLDKLIDELAKGKTMDKILRK